VCSGRRWSARCWRDGPWRPHRTRDVGADKHLAVDRRHVGQRQLQGVFERPPDAAGHRGVGGAVGGEELVGHHARAGDRPRIDKPSGDEVGQPGLLEHAVPRERVQVHARRLPRGVPRDLAPLGRPQIEGRQHLERHVGYRRPVTRLERLELLHERRKRGPVHFAAEQVTVERLARGRRRLRVHHPHDVGQ